MNILDNNLFDMPEDMDAEYVMSKGMGHIWDMCIEPMIEQGNLTDEDRCLISIIGMTFKIVAHKAKCYEDSQEGVPTTTDNDFSRN